MMSQVICQESMTFLAAVLQGAILAWLYNCLQVLRKVFRHSNSVISAEDFFYWLFAGFMTFCLLFQKTEGEIRGYAAAGAILGAVCYRVLCSRIFTGSILFLVAAAKKQYRRVRLKKEKNHIKTSKTEEKKKAGNKKRGDRSGRKKYKKSNQKQSPGDGRYCGNRTGTFDSAVGSESEADQRKQGI